MPRERLIVIKSKTQESNDLLDEYSESLQINKLALDNCLIEQCSVYYNVGIAYANAVSARDYAKSEMDRAKADADRDIRHKAAEENQRVTEAQIANLILDDPIYAKTYEDHLEWKTISEKWLVLKESFAQRAYVLRDLCQLWISNYYADTAIQSDTHEARDRLAADARAAEAIERRRRREP